MGTNSWNILFIIEIFLSLYIEKVSDPAQQKEKCNFINSYNDNDVSQISKHNSISWKQIKLPNCHPNNGVAIGQKPQISIKRENNKNTN